MDLNDALGAYRSRFDDLIGTEITEASGERVVATVTVGPHLHQPFGIVHGGVYASVIESTASIGATLWLDGDGAAVGVSNHTDFLKSISDGRLTFTATPISQGRSLQLWTVEVREDEGARVASGRVRLMNLRGTVGPPPEGQPPAQRPTR